MIQIVQLHGTDKKLYELVAPLVMSPEVLKQNYNYPFRTSEEYEWFVALDNKHVVGFVPVEHKKYECVINNYYIKERNVDTLKLLLEKVLEKQGEESSLTAVSFVEDRDVFSELGFLEDKVWTRYVKMKKKQIIMATPKNVYELAQERLDVIFREFDTICVSFSGGKDSGVLLNLCIDYIRRNRLNRKLCVFHMDYEIQYSMTIDYVDRVLEANKDILEVYRVCVPFRVTTCTSRYQSYWRPWQEDLEDIWVRKMPKGCLTKETFPFYTPEMWDYEFQMHFAKWLHEKKDGVRACFLIGIRTQESFNRWRSIHLNRKYQMYHNYRWTSKIGNDIFNAYPIYDWKTTDIWTANGKFGFDYNHLYDLYYKAGVNIERQRVASPFLCEAQESLKLYRVIDPNTWGRMIGRVNGVNFTGIYGGTRAMGWQTVRLPEGYTWKGFMQFLLSTLPEETRRNYLKKLTVSIEFWRTKGGCLADETIQKLRDAGVSIEVINTTNYKTNKKPVRMDYLDDIDIAEFREIPTYKRMCICILKNDHACKYMGFALNKEEAYKRDKIMEQFKNMML